jgi:predicted HicB family RNase H-like nuclease
MAQQRPTTPKHGVWQIILDLLFDNLGELVTNEQLVEATNQHNYARRLRELRAEGWQIVYKNSPSGYIMPTTDRVEKNPGEYVNLRLRTEVLERDNYTCQMCGFSAGQKYQDGEVVRLEADHILPLAEGGQTTVDNLQTLCSRCNAGKKAVAAYSTIDDKVSLVLRLEKETFEMLEAEAKKLKVSVKQLIQTRLEEV